MIMTKFHYRTERQVLLSCTLALCIMDASAQLWCHAGSEWRYTTWVYEPAWEPVATIQVLYTGDTVFEGESCQVLRTWLHVVDTSGVPHSLGPESNYTTTGPDVIRFWNDYVDVFDTLIFFGGGPGTTWRFNLFNDPKTITVLDTGHRTVSGIELRYSVVDPGLDCICSSPDTIFERIGALQLFNPFPLTTYFIDGSNGPLDCYRDEGFEYVAPFGEGDCSIMLGVPFPMTSLAGLPEIYPNPGSVGFAVHSGQPMGSILIRDAIGRTILRAGNTPAVFQVDTACWPAGCYTVEVNNNNGHRAVSRWIKQ